MKLGISQEARQRGVSRQYVWAERAKAAGRCCVCGEKRVNAQHCEACRIKSNQICSLRNRRYRAEKKAKRQ
jgi:hypothetical protein